MLTKIHQLYAVFALCILCVQSISITSIVRFDCDKNKLKNSQNCMGTFILPNLVLTTSFCAESCDKVGNMEIAETFVHPHYKNFVHGKDFFTRNDIALVRIPDEKIRKNRKVVTLSALDTFTAYGKKALVPIMEINKPRLQVTLIKSCSKTGPFGYYVCTANKINKKTIRVCEETLDQGIPLLLDDKVFGVAGVRDIRTCSLPQRRFTAIGPALSWIGETVTMLGYRKQEIPELQEAAIGAYETNTTTTTGPTTELTDPDVTFSDEISEKLIRRALGPNAKRYFGYNGKEFNELLPIRSSSTRKPSTISSTTATEMARILLSEVDLGKVLRAGFFTPSPATEDTAITFKPKPTLHRRRTTTPRTTKTTTTKDALIQRQLDDNVVSKATNVMDWFNSMVKNKLKNSPAYFIISTSTASIPPYNKNFIDLT